MGRKAKIISEIKIKIVEDYLAGKISIGKAAIDLGINESSIRLWLRKYKTFGLEGLRTSNKNSYYTSDIKLRAVTDYLSGKGSLPDICSTYNISSESILRKWIKKYNSGHKIFKPHNTKGDNIMTTGRKTTYQERIEIVSFCIANANDYNSTANKYNVSYQQVYTWVRKYNKNGHNALVDRRGKNKDFEELSESEKFASQLKLLEAENRRLKMENDFLKKLEEIERG